MIVKGYPKVIRKVIRSYPKRIRFGQNRITLKLCKLLNLQWMQSFKIPIRFFIRKWVQSDNFSDKVKVFKVNGLQREKSYPILPTPKGAALRFRMRSRRPRGFLGKFFIYFRAMKKNGGV